MFRFICLFAVLLFFSSIVSARECEVKITADIPAFAGKFDLSIEVNFKNYPVSQKSPSICISRKDLGVYPLKYSQASAWLMIGRDGKKWRLSGSRIHLQKNDIFIDHKTNMASLVCPYYCGFYEYQRLIADPEIIKISETFLKDIANQPEVLFDRVSANEFYSPYLKQMATIYDTYLKASISLPEIPVHKGYYSVKYSSGFGRYWDTYLKKGSYFDTIIKPAIKNLPKGNQFESVYAAYKKDMIKAVSPASNWGEKKKIIRSVSEKLAKNENNTLKKISQLFLTTVDEVEKRFDDAINNNDVKFVTLSDRKLDPEEVVAHWFRFSYHYANDIEKFQSLFSSRFKKQILYTIENDNELDRSLSRAIARYGRLLKLFNKTSDERIYKRLLYEYQGAVEVSNGHIIVKDKFEKIRLIFEDNAWRLDDFAIDYF